ncbi:hypothetical protein C2845_PM05G05570 [Panicum miliaceum]|uniref:Uncharacterized protein n=1 Tax=Panicum miliaceum TaxID=4540 RepID=A0A3L6T2R2_PANMI|nr:hypothetical protein C2845_PM05G05570 [Panicum miliaceum]
MDDAGIRRERDALQSRIDELSLAQRRLIEIEAAAAQIHDAHFAQPPIVAGDGDQLACAGVAVSSDDAGGSLPRRRDPVPMASGDQYADDLYPLGAAPFCEPAEQHDATPPQLGYQENDGGGVPVMASDDDFYALEDPEDEYRRPLLRYYWDGREEHHIIAVDNYQAAVHDTLGGQQPTPGEAAAVFGDHGGHLLLPDPALYDDEQGLVVLIR